MARWTNFFVILRGQLWLIPALMGLFCLLLAVAVLNLEIAALKPDTREVWWLYSGDAASALTLLSTLLGGLITMMTLVISVTFVTLILAANQLGPRLIRNFVGDRAIQTVIGLFLGSILYLVMVLRSIGGGGEVPHFPVTLGSVLALSCLGALLFYVHKIARAIVADTVVDRVGAELQSHGRRESRDFDSEIRDADEWDEDHALPPQGVIAIGPPGYVQTIEYDDLVTLAACENLTFKINLRAGHFALPNNAHVEICGNAPLNEKAEKSLRAAIVVGSERSPAQDLEFTIRQLVEVCLRALSPGINDPYTAIAVLNQLGAGLAVMASRRMPPTHISDDKGKLRLIVNRYDIDGLVKTAFDQIRQAAQDHPDVLIHIADTIRHIARSARSDAARDALQDQLGRLSETTEISILAPADRRDVFARIAEARDAIDDLPAPG